MTERLTIARAIPLIDIEIERGGDGRTVTAYAATFDAPYEVLDAHGHYMESISRGAFNRSLSRGIDKVQVLFNHGRTLAGTPSERFSMPLGVPIEVRAEAKGLLTRTRYSRTELADEVLQLIADGAIRAQSFRGPIYDSRPLGVDASGLPSVERTELGLIEFGPAPFAVNTGAEILALRSLAEQVATMTDDERAEVARLLELEPTDELADPGPSSERSTETDTDTGPPPAPEAPAPESAVEYLALAAAQRRRRT